MKSRLVFAVVTVFAAVLMFSRYTNGATSDPLRPPDVVAAIVPVYGAVARTAHLGGEVTVEAIVNPKGQVTSVRVLGGHPLLLNAAKEASRQWRFEPAKDSSANRTVSLVFIFKMVRECAPPAELTPIFYPPYKIEVRGETPPITCSDCSPKEQEKLRCPNP
jgi:TonB family protein